MAAAITYINIYDGAVQMKKKKKKPKGVKLLIRREKMGIRGIDISWILLEDPSRMTLGGFFLLFGGTRSGGRFGKKKQEKKTIFWRREYRGRREQEKKGAGSFFLDWSRNIGAEQVRVAR